MVRMLVALLALSAVAWWYLTAGGTSSQPLEAQHKAIEKAEAVEAQLQQHVDNMNHALLLMENGEQK